ncbi:hypothetical protein EHM82_04755 [bacterium]|nr:MAG: hypothetical protein EHM82_04755 [bacterium]
MSGKIRAIALVLVLAGLLANAAHALPGGAGFPVPDRGGLTAVLWSWLHRLTAVWEKEGSSMDPNGQPQGDAGSQMDPNGQPLSALPAGSTGEAGSSMDPNG